MVTAVPQSWMKIPFEIAELQRQRSQLKWYQFKKKHDMDKLLEMWRDIGWNVGVQIALKDLQEAGIIKPISS